MALRSPLRTRAALLACVLLLVATALVAFVFTAVRLPARQPTAGREVSAT